jgi:hypothetical protein
MMSNVLEFPIMEKNAETLLARLESQAENLEEKYVLLEELHGKLHDAEKQAECMESRYNEVMEEYAKLVGTENVPRVLLEYASNCRIDVNADTLEYIFTFADDVSKAPTQYSLGLFPEDDNED